MDNDRYAPESSCRLFERLVLRAELRSLRIQAVTEGREGRRQLAAEAGEDADDGDTDHGRDHTVLDRGSSGLVRDEVLGNVLHDDLHLS